MNNISLIIIGMAWVMVIVAMLMQIWSLRRQGKQLDALHKQILQNQLARMALDASRETGSMVGPAVLQQMKEMRKPEPSGTTKEEPKQSGVTLKY